MTRFKMTNDVTWGSGSSPRSVSIMAENQAGFDAYAAKAGAALKDSEDLLRNTITALSKKTFDSDMIAYANCYFLTGKSLSSGDANSISAKLQLTLSGLLGMNSTLALKIQKSDSGRGARPGQAAEKGAHGRVIYSTHPHSEPYHTDTDEYVKDYGRRYRSGAIHITGDRLSQGKLGVKTLIHEATHKYADTRDYCYFDEQTPRNSPNKFEDHAKAMNNADSYAWFTVMVGRGNFFSRHFGFNNKM